MPRNFKLTWQPGAGKRPGRWRKKHGGKVYYFPGGCGKSDRDAYAAALREWEAIKVELDATAPKRHQEDYTREIDRWEAVLRWCRGNAEEGMALTAVEKLARLRRGLAADNPKPVRREDTFDGQFDTPPSDPLTERICRAVEAAINAEMPDDTPLGRAFNAARQKTSQLSLVVAEDDAAASAVIVPDTLQLDSPDPLTIQQEIWRDRLEVMQRSATADVSVGGYAETFLAGKKAAVDAGEIAAGNYSNLRRYVNEYVDWCGHGLPAIKINGKNLSGFCTHLLQLREEKGWSSRTTKDRLEAAKMFIRWLWHIEAIPSLPRNLDSRSGGLRISKSTPSVVVFDKTEVTRLLTEAAERTKLFVLLMLNCGMTQKDIADLTHAEVDWRAGRITRKRSKTRYCESVPTVSYLLWPVTRELLRKHRTASHQGLVLVNASGSPLWTEEVQADGSFRKNDNIRTAFGRLQRKTDIKKPLKSLKKTSASLIRGDRRYASLERLFLGHAPQSISDRHYTLPPQSLLDEAVMWLGSEYGVLEGAAPAS